MKTRIAKRKIVWFMFVLDFGLPFVGIVAMLNLSPEGNALVNALTGYTLGFVFSAMARDLLPASTPAQQAKDAAQ